MGTVRRVGASDVPTIPASDATAVVAVEEVLHAPDAMAGFGGQEVTVRLAAPGSVSEGQRATFFTTVLAFGDSLGLAELEHQPAEEEVSALAGRVTDARASAAEQRMQDQVNRADVIVSGRVTDVRQPPAASVLAPGTETPVSEHDPQWMEAVVAVDSVVKGQPAGETVVLFHEPCTYAGGSNGQCGSGGAAFGWKGNINDGSSFNAWKTISGETSSSLVVNTSKGVLINSDGSLPDTSAAIKAGVNLFSTCNGQPNPGLGALCSDANGNPRPTSGSWDAGAYSSASSSASGGQPPSGGQPSPPTGLIGVVR